jgi:hypothetical protein
VYSGANELKEALRYPGLAEPPIFNPNPTFFGWNQRTFAKTEASGSNLRRAIVKMNTAQHLASVKVD